MKPQIPEGTQIGEIEASLGWLLSHTPNFLGAIVIRVFTGKGFILIEYGRPVGYSFSMGDQVIQGAAARRFFEQQESLNASLCRYTEKEFREALAVAWPDALIPGTRPMKGQATAGPGVPGREAGPVPAALGTLSPGRDDTFAQVYDLLEEDLPPGKTAEEVPSSGEGPDAILDSLIRSPGVTAASFLREGSIIASRGGAIPGDLVGPAEEILLPAWEAMALVSEGPLVQVTIQLRDRNITIAPYHDDYLLLMTEPGVNLGQIRRLLHDVLGSGEG